MIIMMRMRLSMLRMGMRMLRRMVVLVVVGGIGGVQIEGRWRQARKRR
jgi:hypothetical protein